MSLYSRLTRWQRPNREEGRAAEEQGGKGLCAARLQTHSKALPTHPVTLPPSCPNHATCSSLSPMHSLPPVPCHATPPSTDRKQGTFTSAAVLLQVGHSESLSQLVLVRVHSLELEKKK
ncbi:hypothetical protein E2C01_059949 [Portunus trituberculatus]|uniref:Uncharacterized protein n=1 Tax=Portunus trituberculatus TaxID=210409 RepID=A0A5B7H6S5_PORTR|nr:hypothetical protein [Portunus trituberculatus]